MRENQPPMNSSQFVSAFGVVAMVGIAWIFSKNRKAINWRTIGWATALQLIIAVLVLKTPPGRWFFAGANQAAVRLSGLPGGGVRFGFSSFAGPPGAPGSLGFFFACQVLTSIVFL